MRRPDIVPMLHPTPSQCRDKLTAQTNKFDVEEMGACAAEKGENFIHNQTRNAGY
jgi:hypothetical protein